VLGLGVIIDISTIALIMLGREMIPECFIEEHEDKVEDIGKGEK